MTGLEIFNRVVYGQMLFHRGHDVWDLIDEDGLVAAVLCPRSTHLTISLPKKRAQPKPAGRRIPYGEKKWDEIGEHDIDRGIALIGDLARRQQAV
jgi:hypothetical protein